MVNKTTPPKKRNPIAQTLSDPKYRKRVRVVRNKYDRNTHKVTTLKEIETNDTGLR